LRLMLFEVVFFEGTIVVLNFAYSFLGDAWPAEAGEVALTSHFACLLASFFLSFAASTPLVQSAIGYHINFTNTFLLSLPLNFQVPCQPAVTFHPNILLTFQSNTFNHQPLLF